MNEKEDPRVQLGPDSSFMTKVDFFFNRERKALYCEMALMLTGALIITLIPFIIGKWLDVFKKIDVSIVDFHLGNTTWLVIAVMVTIVLWYILVTSGRSRYVRNIAMNKLRREFLKKVDRKDVNYIEKRSAGKYVEYISSEQQNLSRMFNSDIISLVEGLFVFIIVIILMMITNLTLALIYIILLPFMYLVIRRAVRSMKKDVTERQKSFSKMNSYLDDVSSNYSLIKMYGLEGKALEKYTDINTKMSKQYRHALYAAGYVSPMERVVENVGFILSGIIGVILLNHGSITTGMFLTFVSYTSMMGKPLANFADGLGRLNDSSISLKRVCKFLTSREDDRHGETDAECSNGDISFKDVSYTSESGKKVIESTSFDIKHGEHIGIVGASGSGKSSIIDIMVAMQSVTSGSVTYGGRNVMEYEKNSLRRSISVMPSDPWILNGTIIENIRVAVPDASDEDIMRACRFIGFDKSVERMENGYDTTVGSGLGNMSLAERQMLSLVRLILSDPKVVVFDDSFTGMDALSSIRIKEKLTDFLKDRTVIVVSDDLTDMVAVDRIIFIDNGKITAGQHEELMSIPEYTRLLDNTI